MLAALIVGLVMGFTFGVVSGLILMENEYDQKKKRRGP